MPTSLYYNPDENKDAFSIKWRRLKDIIVDDKEIDVPWAVFRMPQPSDISQGKLDEQYRGNEVREEKAPSYSFLSFTVAYLKTITVPAIK